MSATVLLDHLTRWRARVPAFSPAELLPWTMENALAGWVRPTMAPILLRSRLFERDDEGLALRRDIGGPISKSQALQSLALTLRDEGLVPGWRDELHDYVDDWGRVRCTIERAAFRALGMRSRAVHVNGYVGEDQLWLGRRAGNKPTDPGMLDNLAAGLISSGESPQDCLVRELAEEANVPEYLARLARPAGMIRSQRVVDEGVHDETLFCFDLQLPESFTPCNTDGEVSEFTLLDIHTVASRLDELTWDAASVTAEWLVRWLGGET
jgi:8-oxo-dGTP pyrophosphatase MutT (NUDIX family)